MLLIALLAARALASPNADVSGLITDPSNLAAPGWLLQSADTRETHTVSSNQQGEYSAPALRPGPYVRFTVDQRCDPLAKKSMVVDGKNPNRAGISAHGFPSFCGKA